MMMSAVIGFTNIATKGPALRQSRCLAAFESAMRPQTCVPEISNTRCSVCDLILALFMCNSGRRQERLCGGQRLAAKIDAIETSVGDRDRTSRI
jgi:hypothetical protein